MPASRQVWWSTSDVVAVSARMGRRGRPCAASCARIWRAAPGAVQHGQCGSPSAPGRAGCCCAGPAPPRRGHWPRVSNGTPQAGQVGGDDQRIDLIVLGHQHALGASARPAPPATGAPGGAVTAGQRHGDADAGALARHAGARPSHRPWPARSRARWPAPCPRRAGAHRWRRCRAGWAQTACPAGRRQCPGRCRAPPGAHCPVHHRAGPAG